MSKERLPELPTWLRPGINQGVKVLLRHPTAGLPSELPPRYLAMRRSRPVFQAAFSAQALPKMPWDLVGGLLTREELENEKPDLISAAIREAKQETGLDIELDRNADGELIVLDKTTVPLVFQGAGGGLVEVSLTRHIVSGQAPHTNVTFSKEHEPTAWWLPFSYLEGLGFDNATTLALGRIAVAPRQ